jgi:hypothetical protein
MEHSSGDDPGTRALKHPTGRDQPRPNSERAFATVRGGYLNDEAEKAFRPEEAARR